MSFNLRGAAAVPAQSDSSPRNDGASGTKPIADGDAHDDDAHDDAERSFRVDFSSVKIAGRGGGETIDAADVSFRTDLDGAPHGIDTNELPDPREDADAPAPESHIDLTLDDRDESDAGDDDDESEEDEWAEVSHGRYFASTDPEVSAQITDSADREQLCHNCKGVGHRARNCPHRLCRTCGAVDDHNTERCPMTQRCYNCSRLGHPAAKCPDRQRMRGEHCRSCGSKAHAAASCPQIWRLYWPRPQFSLASPWEDDVAIFCYNCAARGHYGDDCPRPHRTRFPDNSAFCEDNLPDPARVKHRADRHGSGRGHERGRGHGGRSDEEDPFDRLVNRRPADSDRYTRQRERDLDHQAGPSRGHTARDRGRERYDPYARPSHSSRKSSPPPSHSSKSKGNGKAKGKRAAADASERAYAARQNAKSGKSSSSKPSKSSARPARSKKYPRADARDGRKGR